MTTAAGPFFFAWTDPTETTFGVEHEVEDEQIVGFVINGSENDCPTLTLDIRNPRIGLLNAGRKVWAWLSYDSGTGGAVPLFFGRLVGVPTNILQEVVTLAFVAKPLDFLAQKAAMAETLKVRPFYDPVFIDPDKRDDPETVLEGYPALWHVDRTTLAVTVSNIIEGEDGTLNFGADEVPYDSVDVTIGSPPLTSITVTGTVQWTQSAVGTVDFGSRSFANGANLLNSWPTTGDQLAGGWSVAEGNAVDTLALNDYKPVNLTFNYENKQKHHENGDTMSLHIHWTKDPPNVADLTLTNIETRSGFVPSEGSDLEGSPLHVSYNMNWVVDLPITTTLKLQYDAANNRQETVRFTLAADLQAIVTLPEPGDVEELLEINGSDVGIAIDEIVPVGDASSYGYFPTDRGLWSLEYLISVARAHVLARARAVSVSWDCSFARALDLSCRKNARLEDDRLPGGQATGKVTAYSISCDGDAGIMLGRVTVQCAIGHDGTVTVVEGTPTYVETGYVNAGYQVYTGDVVLLPGLDDIGYSTPVLEPGGLVFPLTREQVLVSEAVTYETVSVNVGSERKAQAPAWFSPGVVADDTIQIFKNYQVPVYRLEVQPVTGNNFAADYDVAVSTLKIPKLIDLEAAAA